MQRTPPLTPPSLTGLIAAPMEAAMWFSNERAAETDG